MTDRYRLPEALGGGEFTEHRRPDGSTEAPAGTVAFLVDGCIVAVARALLTKVALPVEFPDGSYALAGGDRVYMRDDKSAARGGYGDLHWFADPEDEPTSWDAVVDWAKPGVLVRLVPDPAAGVELPWRGETRLANEVAVAISQNDTSEICVDFTQRISGVLIAADVARAMAAALYAAADAAEAVSHE